MKTEPSCLSQGELAYERLESLIAHLELKPGTFMTMADLQSRVELGRTPVLEAIRKLSDDTLLEVRAGRGVRVTPIDLVRERRLLKIRRDVECFVVELAIENASGLVRNQMHYLERALREVESSSDLRQFNELDRRMDRLLLDAAEEPFVERTLRPLHTIFRRLGYLYQSHLGTEQTVRDNIQMHVRILQAIIDRDIGAAVSATGTLMDFMDGMFIPLERELEPSNFDVSIKPLVQEQTLRGDEARA